MPYLKEGNYPRQYFEFSYHRLGDKEWIIKIKTGFIITNFTVINVKTETKFVGKRGIIWGIGTINFTKERTEINE